MRLNCTPNFEKCVYFRCILCWASCEQHCLCSHTTLVVAVCVMESPQDDDDASCLSYFSSFNRQSFETGETHSTVVDHTEELEKVPHPPMRSTITPINIALPVGDLRPAPKPSRNRRTPKNVSPKTSPSPTSNPLSITTGPIASLVAQHNHSLQHQFKSVSSTSAPMPTIVLQPVLLNLTPEQQLLAAQLQERFFSIVSQAGQNGQGPLAIVAPNLHQVMTGSRVDYPTIPAPVAVPLCQTFVPAFVGGP